MSRNTGHIGYAEPILKPHYDQEGKQAQDYDDPRIAVTCDTEFPGGSNATLMKTRLLLDQQYVQSWHKGRRMRKNPQHMYLLVDYFNTNPVWDYETKVRIAEEIGMTFNQVSKWNWDYRKK